VKTIRWMALFITIVLVFSAQGLVAADSVFLAISSPGKTERVSVASDGSQGNGESFTSSISADGRFVTFVSSASNLVSGDINGHADIFVYDRQTQTIERIAPASIEPFSPSISAGGRFVAFASDASDLVNGDTNGDADIFVYDRQNGTTERVSLASDGTQGYSKSFGSSISANGRFVVFESIASNLVSGDTNAVRDIFVHDRQTGQTERVSVASDGTQGNDLSSVCSLSMDGRWVAFTSSASNLVSGDTNGTQDVFVRDRQTGQTERASVTSNGIQGVGYSFSPSISADGRFVAFHSWGANLVSGDTNETSDVFVHDRQTGGTERVSLASDGTQGNNSSLYPFISANGRFVAFVSNASNLVSGDTNGVSDMFVYDRQTKMTQRVSVDSDGLQGNNTSGVQTPSLVVQSLSSDGHFVAFESFASNLVSGDTNGHTDIFVHVLWEAKMQYVPVIMR
jgi:Tol biopolymer transport system component